jgi:hypothetical protein
MAYMRNTNEQFLQDRLPVGWPWRLLLSMGILLAIVLLVYVGLAFGYESYLNNSISSLNSDLNSLSLQVSPTDRQGFITFYSQLTNLQRLLGSHIVSSQIFPLFENMTDQNVAYNSFDLSVPDNTVSIDGVAKNYATLANQLYLYEQSPQIKNVILEGSSLSNNTVRFIVKITLNNADLNL